LWSFEEAALVPSVFVTAYYSLKYSRKLNTIVMSVDEQDTWQIYKLVIEYWFIQQGLLMVLDWQWYLSCSFICFGFFNYS
jgi:hypothetical protein